jgi:hypothetical protein
MFDWCVVRCGSKNSIHHVFVMRLNYMLKNLLTTLDSLINIVWVEDLDDCLIENGVFTLIMIKDMI